MNIKKILKTWTARQAVAILAVDNIQLSDFGYEMLQAQEDNLISYNQAKEAIISKATLNLSHNKPNLSSIVNEDDPYSEYNGVLKNNLGIINTYDLNTVEADLTGINIHEILKQPLLHSFSITNINIIHKNIFQDIYSWAGEFRTIDMLKGDTFFESYETISITLESLFNDFQSNNYFKNLSIDDFAQHAAEFLIELNRIHPFREGNGRTQRVLLSQLALRAGYIITWEGIGSSAIKTACIDGLDGKPNTMKNLIKLSLSRHPQ